MDALHLSPRLQALADHVPKRSRLADIGSDHAYLPAHLLLTGQIDFAIAGEVAQGPLANAQQEITRHHLADRLQPRLADGLAAIRPSDAIDCVVIAGMGGHLITQILTAGQPRYDRLILQPNTDQPLVRLWLMEHHYRLTAEDVVADDGHRYEIMVAQPGAATYTQEELQFGPYNIRQNQPTWRAKWLQEADRLRQLKQTLSKRGQAQTQAYQHYCSQLKAIEGVLGHASTGLDRSN
ncbi:tRNA (adenine(22)-N(1))-methyltransferase [Weissella halotolerans]|uniref:S-adenosyl-L-methionine-dependent methyltransferase n=1 Tax=Weissella halotolerans DSM 20190 TaxID=1123500 RepID=A0A0R2G5D7_9LACO|nr:class I SAM-dependent methyltransferase [Weissella halotolerans]KRN33397.1 S-adenosyl-L-methionine-dependent methyltransferase [Weissella halotolerans DSM 20190]